MAKKHLPNKGDFRKIQSGDPGYTPANAKARWMYSPSQGIAVPQAKYQKIAGSEAPSRNLSTKVTHTVPTLIHATEKAKVSQTLRNRRAFAETYSMSLRDASRDQYLKIYNKEWNEGLKRLNKLEGSRKRKDAQSAEEVELRKKMNELAKRLGRKEQDDYSDFGSTDTI